MASLAEKFMQSVNQSTVNKETDKTGRTEIMPGGVKSIGNFPPDSTDRTEAVSGGGGVKLPSSMQKNSHSEVPNRIRSSNFEQIKGHEFNSALSKENKEKGNQM
jgi:hypothetical protein